MRKYSIAVFDVDGTLLDTTEGVLSSVQHTIQEFHLPSLTQEELRTFIGPPIQDSFAKFYGAKGKMLQELAECFREQYKTKDLLKARPYPGIYETIEKLKINDVGIAIATYKRQDYARQLLYHFQFDKYTKVIYGADNYNKLKKSDIIIKCMKDLGVSEYSKAVMIGDTDNDAVGAQKIGMKFLGVTYGFGFTSNADVKQYPSIGSVSSAYEILQYFL